MKLSEMFSNGEQSEVPMAIALMQKRLAGEKPIVILDRDGVEQKLLFAKQRDLDKVWVIRFSHRNETDPLTRFDDLRLAGDAEIDYLLDIQSADGKWVVKPNWQRIRELGYH